MAVGYHPFAQSIVSTIHCPLIAELPFAFLIALPMWKQCWQWCCYDTEFVMSLLDTGRKETRLKLRIEKR